MGVMTWGVIILQVFGGLIVGMVVKYTDTVLKNFANAVSVILTVLLAIPLFGLRPNSNFIFGLATVLLSISLYSNTAGQYLVILRRASGYVYLRQRAFRKRMYKGLHVHHEV